MHRRLVGGLLFAVALTLSVVIPSLGGLRVAGVATTILLPDDPRVGDCVQEPLNDIIVLEPASPGSSLAPSFVPCDGRKVGGEVIAVVQAVGSPRARLKQAEASVDCYHSSLEYSGLVLVGGRYVLADHYSNDPVDWNITINVRTAWVVPTPLLRTSGRTWVACIAAPLSGASFRGRLAGAYNGGKLPDEFGFCWEQRTPSARGSVSCGGRHLAELVSLGSVPDGAGIPLASITSSCQRLAAQVVGRSDPTVAGYLAVGTSVSPVAAPSSTPGEPLHVICDIEPVTQSLSGTLVGLRNGPIPYSR